MSVLDSLFNVFPPPALLTMRHSGISLSDDGIRIIRLHEKNRGNHLDVHCFEPLPAGIIKSGTIEKPEELIKVLKKLQKQYSIDFIAASLPDEKAYIFKATIPRQEQMNLSDVVAFKIQETVPVSGANAVYDFNVIASTPTSIDVVVRVAHVKAVTAYSNVFRSSGMRPTLFKIQSQAVVDAVLPSSDNDPHIALHIESFKTTCMIVEKRSVIFSIVLEVGTDAMVSAVMKAFSVDMNTARSIMKGEVGVSKPHDELFFAITNIISVIRDQVMKLQDFWKTKQGATSDISSIIVSGFPACIDGFGHYLEMSTGVPTHVASVWENALSINKQVPPVHFADSLDYAPAIGLALPHKLHL